MLLLKIILSIRKKVEKLEPLWIIGRSKYWYDHTECSNQKFKIELLAISLLGIFPKVNVGMFRRYYTRVNAGVPE